MEVLKSVAATDNFLGTQKAAQLTAAHSTPNPKRS